MAYIGHGLIVLAGAGLGFWLAHRLRRQERYLEQAAQLLQAMEQQVAFAPRPMVEVWQYLADSGEFSCYDLLQHTLERLPQTDFCTAFAEAVEWDFSNGLLTPVGKQLLLEFGAGCGPYDQLRQEAHIRHYRERLLSLQDGLRRQVAEKSRLYRMMGLAGGGALALLLL